MKFFLFIFCFLGAELGIFPVYGADAAGGDFDSRVLFVMLPMSLSPELRRGAPGGNSAVTCARTADWTVVPDQGVKTLTHDSGVEDVDALAVKHGCDPREICFSDGTNVLTALARQGNLSLIKKLYQERRWDIDQADVRGLRPLDVVGYWCGLPERQHLLDSLKENLEERRALAKTILLLARDVRYNPKLIAWLQWSGGVLTDDV